MSTICGAEPATTGSAPALLATLGVEAQKPNQILIT